jgi:hypothetical protein
VRPTDGFSLPFVSSLADDHYISVLGRCQEENGPGLWQIRERVCKSLGTSRSVPGSNP